MKITTKKQKAILDFIEQTEATNEARLRAALEEKGESPFLRLKQGENTFTLMPILPEPRISNFGKQQGLFQVDQNGERYAWSVTETSPMYIKVVRQLAIAPVELTVIRIGTGTATRVDLKQEEA